MHGAKSPRSLGSWAVSNIDIENGESGASTRKVTSIAGLIAVASITGAEAQQPQAQPRSSELPPITVDSPKPRATTAKPSEDQKRATAALRRAAKRQQQANVKPVPYPNAGQFVPPDADPYANPNAPYQALRVQSNKFTEPLLNTPKTITVLTKDVLEDKNATTLREVGRSTAGVTLGSGEGGNAFGDRFFIRGFDARSDVFIDGIRDPSVSIRENFFTEQVEILRGPASSYAGRGTAGGAINIVTKQAGDRNFYNAETTFGTDQTKRVTLDVNQVLSPTVSMRAGGLFQDADVAGRNHVTDDRWGTFAAVKWTPTNNVKVTANYVHTDLSGLPDFGIPYYRQGNVPVTEVGVPRGTWYGFVNRDYSKSTQDFGTVAAEVKVNDNITVSSRFRAERSVLDYIGTLPQSPVTTNPNPLNWTVTASAQSRYQVTDVLANQNDATFKFDTGSWKHTAVFGAEFSNEQMSIDRYSGLASEVAGSNPFTSNGALANQSIFYPAYTNWPFTGSPVLTGNPTRPTIDSSGVYLIDTANYNDILILNGGVRYDDYDIKTRNNTSSSSAHDGLFNYNAGIVLKPLPNGSVYAAYATSSNPIGQELDATSADYGGLSPTLPSTQILGPELNTSAEVGTKWELFNRNLLVTAALFQTTKDNARETIGSGASSTLTGGGGYRIQGIDLGAGGKITDKWSIFGGLVLMESKVTKSAVASNIGDKLANVAHQSFSLLSKYQFDNGWELGGQAVYRSKVYGGTLAANVGTELPSYWRFDTFVEKKVNKNVTMKIYVQNIFDKLYYDTLYRSAAPFVAVAPGRAAYLITSVKF
jgi:catecholate siderophore receptor